MKTLTRVKCGWKWLERTINDLMDVMDQRTISVTVGGGLDAVESQSGTLLTLSADTLKSIATAGGGPTPDPNKNPCGWQMIKTIDANCNPMNQYVWGGPPFVPGRTTPN